jgi:hypothetical protein
MTGRPDLADVAAAVLEETPPRGTRAGGYRVRPAAAFRIAETFWCRHAHHLQGVIVRTAHGLAVVWRPADTSQAARDVWAEEWLDDAPEQIRVTCHCRVNRAVDLTPYRTVR